MVILGENVYIAVVRVVLVGFHTLWAVISAGFLLGQKGPGRFFGLAFAILAHAFYDMPPLAGFSGYSAEAMGAVAVVSTAFMLLTPVMVKRATGLLEGTLKEKEHGEPRAATSGP